MSKIDLLYEELRENKKKFNIARVVTAICTLIPFLIGVINNQYIWAGVSVIVLIGMMSFVGIPTLKKIQNIKSKIKEMEDKFSYD